MKPFHFRLEKLLHIRQSQSRMAKNALATARLRSRQATALLEAAKAERTASEQALLAKRLQGMSVLEWRLTSQMHEAMIQREDAAKAALLAALDAEERRRQELAEAERREKSLDKLKERRAAEYRYAAEAWEQAQIDEMAQNIYREGGVHR